MKKTALIIEDDDNNRVLITRLLEKAGYNIITAETGKQGVETAASSEPDFIILDIQLPDIMGTRVLELIRKAETDRKIPVIAMTSYAMAGDREKMLNAGCDGYIEKPIDPIRVISQIENILRRD
jgi:two-component system cell cycle response regulator DivK